MGYIAELKPTNDPLSYWGNTVKDSIRSNTPVLSADFVGDASPGGTSIALAPKLRYPQQPDTYRGEWDITASYDVGDIVRVMPNRDYIYTDLAACADVTLSTSDNTQTPTTYPAGTVMSLIHPKGSSSPYMLALYIKPIPGVYRCCSPVPSMFGYIDLYTNGNISAGGSVIVGITYTATPSALTPAQLQTINGFGLRFWDVNYFPVWPELPTRASIGDYGLPSGADNFLGAKGRYWELISLMPSFHTWTTCKNGSKTILRYWADEQNKPTGSYLNATGSTNVATW